SSGHGDHLDATDVMSKSGERDAAFTGRGRALICCYGFPSHTLPVHERLIRAILPRLTLGAQIPAVLSLVVSHRAKSDTLRWGHGSAILMNSRLRWAGGTGIEPAPCGFGVRLVPSTSVRTRLPRQSFTGFHATQCRLVFTCVAMGCCQSRCQNFCQ